MEKFKYNFDNFELTENGAMSYKSTNSTMVDQFGKAANYRGRGIDVVFKEQEALWINNPEQALRFPFYLRMITRKVKVNNSNVTEKVQKGQGVRDEAFKRLLWVALAQPDSFYKNIWILPLIGSWKDLWTLMYYDVAFKVNAINKEIIFDLINEGLKCNAHVELIKKFMPRIKTNTKCTTDWTKITNSLAHDFANYNGLSYKDYNKLKASGTAHDFQKLICSGRYKDINWNLIPGRAMSKITSGNFLAKHDIEKGYTDWVMAQPTVKFTGYVYELFKEFLNNRKWGVKYANIPLFKKITIDKQFDELINKAKQDGNVLGNVWCALDTSGSMGTTVVGNITAYDICVSLGIFFSTLNTGAFHKNVVMFDDISRSTKLNGGFCDMARQIVESKTAWGSTNFLSIIREMVNVRRSNPEIPLEEYPDTILVVSDMQFNPVDRNAETNYERMKSMLYNDFPKEFVDNMKFVWWQVTGRTKDFPAEIGSGQIFISGFDGSIISLLLGGEAKEIEKQTGKPITSEEAVQLALSQEILSYVVV